MLYQECIDYLLSIPLFAGKLGTENLNEILNLMGHPEKNAPVIHVAGTNGKGSTCSFLASILQAKGYRVGLFTSPHLVKLNERFSVNGISISDSDLVDVFELTMQYIDQAKELGVSHPSFFEFVFLMSAIYFKKQNVDYVIYETGMGGRLDATNIVAPILTLITSVGLDHTQFLGETLEEIAAEKAGIVKPGVPMIHFHRNPNVSKVIGQFCEKNDSELIFVEKKDINIEKITEKTIDFSYDSGYYTYERLQIKRNALYQVENATLAIKAYEMIIRFGALPECKESDEESHYAPKDIDIIRTGLLAMNWPCRMQEIAPHIFVDGAHNIEAIHAFCETLEVLYKNYRKVLMFSVSKDKDYNAMIERLSHVFFDEIILVKYEGERSEEISTIESTFKRFFGGSIITSFRDIESGFEYGRSHVGDGYMFCVGSLYLAGDLLQFGD